MNCTTACGSPMRRWWRRRPCRHRYITDRFLPDKAIDLMDEAACRLRMEVDSKPEELDAAGPADPAIPDRDRGVEERGRRGLEGPAGEAGEGTGRPAAEIRRNDREMAGRTGQPGSGPGAEGTAGPRAGRTGSGQTRRQFRQGRRAAIRPHSGAGEGAYRGRGPRGRGFGRRSRAARADRRGGGTLDRHSGDQNAGRRDAKSC